MLGENYATEEQIFVTGSQKDKQCRLLANHGPERWSAKDLAYMYAPMEAAAHAV